jgi:hypothetical protein
VDSKHDAAAAASNSSKLESLCLSEDRKKVLHMPGYMYVPPFPFPCSPFPLHPLLCAPVCAVPA